VIDVPDIDRSSTAERVAGALREMLFAGGVAPGDPLREISLQVLAAEGLVTRYPNRGVVVTELTARDIAEIFEARLVLETAGVRAGAGGRDLSAATLALSAYAAAAKTDDPVEQTEAHLEFHTSLVALLGNSRMVAQADALNQDLRLALASVQRARRNARAQVADHRRLLSLMRAGDEAGVTAELEHHLRGAAVSVTERLLGP
jgi:DNA-binding GntR family transcriptional regulator